MMDPEVVPRLMGTGTIEDAPPAYIRGCTLNDSFVGLDETQNTTPEQMKMFLTRLGFGTKMVVTGDITQIDLPMGSSGLQLVTKVLPGIPDIHFSRLTSEDVVRHTLVGKLVDEYTKDDQQQIGRRWERRRERAERAPGPEGPRVPGDYRPPQNRAERRAQDGFGPGRRSG